MKFEIYPYGKSQFGFRLKSANGQIVCASEGYIGKRKALKAIALVRRSYADPVVDLTLPAPKGRSTGSKNGLIIGCRIDNCQFGSPKKARVRK